MMIAKIFHVCYSWIHKTVARMVKKSNKPTFEFATLNPNERLREMILYIVERLHGDSTFGATKLNKILFFSDFHFYAVHGEPITGARYKKDEFGPVPTDIGALLKQMQSAGELEQKKHTFGRTKRSVFAAKRQARLTNFSREQIAEVDMAINTVKWMKSEDVSDMSHTRLWEIARMGEPIPYEAALISDAPLTNYEIRRTKKLCSQYGWEN
jgi:hypothetical protein